MGPILLLVLLYPYFVGEGGTSGPIERGVEYGEPATGGFVWNGFRHEWSYNHRLSRLGGWIDGTRCREIPVEQRRRFQCDGNLYHAGASGAGPDTLEFASYYTAVQTESVGFLPLRVRLHFTGEEQAELVDDLAVSFEPPAPLDGRQKYLAVLNGYDIRLVGGARAKKVKRLQFAILDQPERDPKTGRVAFRVGGTLDMNCDSVECKQQGDRVEYALDVYLLLVAGDDEVHAETKDFSIDYAWDRRQELTEETIPLNGGLQYIDGADEAFGEAFLGFTGIDFNLGHDGDYRDHWFVGWTQVIRDVRYDPQAGLARFDLALLFKEWNRRTRRRIASITRAGEASLQASVALVQIKQARVRREYEVGTLKWPGKNQSPNTKAARWRQPIDVRFEE